MATTLTADSPEWTVDANETIRLSLGAYLPSPLYINASPSLTDTRPTHQPILCSRHSAVRAADDKAGLTSNECYEGFHPTFTYPVRPIRADVCGCAACVLTAVLDRYTAKTRSCTAIRTSS